MREPHFRQHDVHFLLHWDTNGSTAEVVDYNCHRVPFELQEKPWYELLALRGSSLRDQLVLHQSPVMGILRKFERKEFIHVYVRALASSNSAGGSGGNTEVQAGSSTDKGCGRTEHTMTFSLPRFSLEFELRSGRLWSLEYAASFLRPCQQLVAGDAYTLPGFAQYLVLQHEPQQPQQGHGGAPSIAGSSLGGLKVLLPAGQVQRSTGGVAVLHDGSSGAQLEVSSSRT